MRNIIYSPSEKELQRYAESLLNLYQIYYVHIPNVVSRKIRGQFISVKVDKGGKFRNKGVSDLVIVGPYGRVFFVELKTLTGRLSEDQVEFMEYCMEHGHPYELCRSREDIDRIINIIRRHP